MCYFSPDEAKVPSPDVLEAYKCKYDETKVKIRTDSMKIETIYVV